ncbi:hypothetical protein [Streptomyces sp. CA-132043]
MTGVLRWATVPIVVRPSSCRVADHGVRPPDSDFSYVLPCGLPCVFSYVG